MNIKNFKLKKYYFLTTAFSTILSFIFASLFSYNKLHSIKTDSFTVGFFIRFAVIFLFSIGLAILLKKRPAAMRFSKQVFTVYEKKNVDFSSLVCGTVVFFLAFYLALQAPVDYGFHIEIACSFDFRDVKGIFLQYSTPLWHVFVRIFNLILSIPPLYSAALTSALLFVLTYHATLCIIREAAQAPFAKKYAPHFSAMLMFVQPIYLPWFNDHQIYGQGSPNIMHNPTNIAAKPFAIICAYLIVKLLMKIFRNEKIEAAEYVRLSLFMFISVIAKPSAIQVVLPALAIFLLISLISSKGKTIFICLKTAAACVPAFLWMLFTFYLSFISDVAQTPGGIAFSFFDVWKEFSDCIPLSILLVTLFPLVEIAVLYRKNDLTLNKLGIAFGVVTVIIGIMEYAFIMETGDRKLHGNFSWGYNIALGLLWTFTTSHMLENSDKKDKGVAWGIVCTAFIVHFIYGVYYYLNLV